MLHLVNEEYFVFEGSHISQNLHFDLVYILSAKHGEGGHTDDTAGDSL